MNDSANLHALIAELRRELAALKRENAALKQENAELRRRLGLDSSNSSKPPSSDGPAKGNTLRQSETPDKIEHHKVCVCAHCEIQLDASNVVDAEKRQVFDIPEPKLYVTEHQADISRCATCGKISKAAFPEARLA